MKPWTATVVGCGRIGSSFSAQPHQGVVSHAEAIVNNPHTRLVAVCDTHAASANGAAELWGLDAAWSDLGGMLARARPDIVSICVPDSLHFEVGKEVMMCPSTKVVIMEKPLALNLAEARGLVKLAGDRNIGLAVNYSRRFATGIQRLKSILAAGGIGEIQCVTGHYTNGLLHNGSHWLDLLTSLLGRVTTIAASNPLQDAGGDPTLELRLELAGGGTVSLQPCREAFFSCFDMDIIGRTGRATIGDFGNLISLSQVAPDPQYAGFSCLRQTAAWAGGLDQALPAMLTNALGYLNGSEALCSTGADALQTLELCFAGRESHHRGHSIRLSS
ncbi:MAG: Gfo/Idh/MocA family oxidoreductase [Verrucomicrobiota bacterium]